MDAVTYIKEVMRMCESSDDNCEHCPAKSEKFCPISLCKTFMNDMHWNEEKAASIVENWSKDHPVKTRKSEFLKMFPNSQMVNIERTFCIAHFDLTKVCKESNPSDEKCIACRYRFWNEEVTDND